MSVKSRFENADQLIAKVKSTTVKNKTRYGKVAINCWPPKPVVTKWESWLNAAYVMRKIYLK